MLTLKCISQKCCFVRCMRPPVCRSHSTIDCELQSDHIPHSVSVCVACVFMSLPRSIERPYTTYADVRICLSVRPFIGRKFLKCVCLVVFVSCFSRRDNEMTSHNINMCSPFFIACVHLTPGFTVLSVSPRKTLAGRANLCCYK